MSTDDWAAEAANDWDQWCSDVETIEEQQHEQQDQPETQLATEEHW